MTRRDTTFLMICLLATVDLWAGWNWWALTWIALAGLYSVISGKETDK